MATLFVIPISAWQIKEMYFPYSAFIFPHLSLTVISEFNIPSEGG